MDDESINKLLRKLQLGGTQINYYFICKTKLWLFSHKITFEDTSDLVRLGKLLHKMYYNKEEKDVIIDSIAIDFIKNGNVLEVHEIKKSDREFEADKFQALYYLYFLKKKGISNAVAIINYVKLGKVVRITLSEESEREIKEVIDEIKSIISLEKPPEPVKMKKCTNCAYYYFCWG